MLETLYDLLEQQLRDVPNAQPSMDQYTRTMARLNQCLDKLENEIEEEEFREIEWLLSLSEPNERHSILSCSATHETKITNELTRDDTKIAGELTHDDSKIADELTRDDTKIAGELTQDDSKVADELTRDDTKIVGELTQDDSKIAGELTRGATDGEPTHDDVSTNNERNAAGELMHDSDIADKFDTDAFENADMILLVQVSFDNLIVEMIRSMLICEERMLNTENKDENTAELLRENTVPASESEDYALRFTDSSLLTQNATAAQNATASQEKDTAAQKDTATQKHTATQRDTANQDSNKTIVSAIQKVTATQNTDTRNAIATQNDTATQKDTATQRVIATQIPASNKMPLQNDTQIPAPNNYYMMLIQHDTQIPASDKILIQNDTQIPAYNTILLQNDAQIPAYNMIPVILVLAVSLQEVLSGRFASKDVLYDPGDSLSKLPGVLTVAVSRPFGLSPSGLFLLGVLMIWSLMVHVLNILESSQISRLDSVLLPLRTCRSTA